MVRDRDIPPEVVSVDYISNQITIEANTSSPTSNIEKRGRLEYIDSQRGNRYSSSICPLYLVHVESLDGNIGNLHPMSLGKTLADIFPAITNIKRRGRNLIIINFKFSFDANQFIQSNLVPKNWIAYIPNYKIFRSDIVKGVDMILSDEIHKGLKFIDRLVDIKSITRLKFRDKYNNELRRGGGILRQLK